MELPDKLSGLLRIAVEDAKKSEAEGHTLDMGVWLAPPQVKGGKCTVCMAGSVMLQRLAVEELFKRNYEISPADFRTQDLTGKLGAINDMRRGYFYDAYEALTCRDVDEDDTELTHCLNAASSVVEDGFYTQEGRAPWETYLQAADILEKDGY